MIGQTYLLTRFIKKILFSPENYYQNLLEHGQNIEHSNPNKAIWFYKKNILSKIDKKDSLVLKEIKINSAYRIAQLYLRLNESEQAYLFFDKFVSLSKQWRLPEYKNLIGKGCCDFAEFEIRQGNNERGVDHYIKAEREYNISLELKAISSIVRYWCEKQRSDEQSIRYYMKFLRLSNNNGETPLRNKVENLLRLSLEIKPGMLPKMMKDRHYYNLNMVMLDHSLYWPLKNIAIYHINTKEYSKAQRCLNMGMKYFPSEEEKEFYFLLGQTCFFQKEYDNCLRNFNTAIEKGLDRNMVNYWQGVAYGQTGDLDKAEICFNGIMERDNAHFNAYVQVGNIYFNRGNYEKAAKYYKEVLEHDQHHTGALYGISRYYQHHKDYTQSINYLNVLINKDPDHLWGNFSLATLYEDIGQLEKACICYNLVIELDKQFIPAYAKLGVLLLRSDNGSQKQAEHLLRIAWGNGNRSPEISYYLGIIDAKNKDYKAAKDKWIHIQGDQRYGEMIIHNIGILHYENGWDYLERGEWDNSLSEFEEYLKYYPTNQDADKKIIGFIYFQKAREKFKEKVDAHEDLLHAIKYDPNNSFYHYYMAINMFMFNAGATDEMIQHLAKAEGDSEIRLYAIFFKMVIIYSDKDLKNLKEEFKSECVPQYLVTRVNLMILHQAITQGRLDDITGSIPKCFSDDDNDMSLTIDIVSLNLAICYTILNNTNNSSDIAEYLKVIEKHNRLILARAVLLSLCGRETEALKILEQEPPHKKINQIYAKALFRSAGKDINEDRIEEGLEKLGKAKSILSEQRY